MHRGKVFHRVRALALLELSRSNITRLAKLTEDSM